MYRLLQYMYDNNGIVSKYEAMKITASPHTSSSTKVETLDDMIKVLGRLDLVYEQKDSHGINYIIFKKHLERLSSIEENQLMNKHRNRMVADCTLIPDIRWMIKINLIDNTNFIYRNKKTPAIGAQHNNLLWDVFCYTKTTGINPIVGPKADTIDKQTMVAIDIVLFSSYDQIQLDGFYDRIQINRNSVKNSKRKVLPIVVYRECPEIVLAKMRKLGFLAFDIGSIFGAKIYSVLHRLNEMNTLLTSEMGIEAAVEDILSEIRNAGQEDALRDLKGVLFEAMMYPLLSRIYSNSTIERGRTLTMVNDEGVKTYYEYDYIITSNFPDEIILVELKGYSSGATISLGDKETKSTLKWFFRKTVPFARDYFAKQISEGKKLRAIFLTTANFWEDGRAYIKKLNEGSLKSEFLNTGYERSELLALLTKLNFKKETKIINKYYSKID